MIRLEKTGNHLLRYLKRYKWQVILLALLAIFAVVMAVFFLTKDKTPLVTSGFVIAENEGYQTEKINPLTKNQNEEVDEIIREYYERMAEGSEYIECYENVKVYLKQGRYEGTFVVFAGYELKIPDIYTKIPGLDTLYVYKNETGKFRVTSDIHTEEIGELVNKVIYHNDVQALMTSTEEQYQSAIESDAMLKESLLDLQQASSKKD